MDFPSHQRIVFQQCDGTNVMWILSTAWVDERDHILEILSICKEV